MNDFSSQFDSFLKSPVGQELVRSLREDLWASLIEDAQKAQDAETAYGLLKEAGGVIRTVEHLQFLAVTPKE